MDGLRPAPLSSVVRVVAVVAADGWWEDEGGGGGGAMGWESSSTGSGTGACWGCGAGVEVGGWWGAAMVIRWCVGRVFSSVLREALEREVRAAGAAWWVGGCFWVG